MFPPALHRNRFRRGFSRLILALVLFPLASLSGLGCSTTHHKESADRETYGIIGEKSDLVPGMEEDFSIEAGEALSGEVLAAMLEGLPKRDEEGPAFQGDGGSELGSAKLSLEQALRLAVRNNRTYQNRKESLYLEALSLTLDRHDFAPIFSAVAGGAYNRSTTDIETASRFSEAVTAAGGIIAGIENITGQPAQLLTDYQQAVATLGGQLGLDEPELEIANERSVSGQTSLGASWLMRTGATFAVNLTSDFLRFITGDPRTASSSALSASIAQPLLRGAGRKVVEEQLTQAERDVLYALRDFTRFRKTFVVDVCSDYYQVLQNRDRVRNSYQSYQSFQQTVDRERALAGEGRRTQAELGRLEQALLNNENDWIDSLRRYRQALDNFKIALGLTTDAQVVLDDRELDELRRQGLRHPQVAPQDAVQVALATRLDLYTAAGEVSDAERRIAVAANALKPGLDVILSGRADSSGQDNFEELDFRRARWSAGLDLDLGLDRKAERNAYRSALIAFERAGRAYTLAEDNVKLEVRTAWRTLDQARRNYEIALQSVALGQRRVEEQDLLAELDRATALNQVDAQNDLTRAQNDLTSALVSHAVARLAFWRDMGILYIKKDGQWQEVTEYDE